MCKIASPTTLQNWKIEKLKKIIVHKVHATILPLILISVKYYYILDYLIYLIQKKFSLDFNMGLKITMKPKMEQETKENEMHIIYKLELWNMYVETILQVVISVS